MGIRGVTKGDVKLLIPMGDVGETAGVMFGDVMTIMLCGLVPEFRDVSDEERCLDVSDRRRLVSISMWVGAAPR